MSKCERKTWKAMMERCYEKDHVFYHNYGGRGILVCKRWHDFKKFFADMGERPTPKHTLERINNNLGYRPSNCRWATRTEQARNRRTNRIITVNGVTKLLVEWCMETGIRHSVIIRRLKRGWAPERAIYTPASGKPHSSKRTVCKNGHPYSKENTVLVGKNKDRVCRVCQKAAWTRNNKKTQERKRKERDEQQRQKTRNPAIA